MARMRRKRKVLYSDETADIISLLSPDYVCCFDPFLYGRVLRRPTEQLPCIDGPHSTVGTNGKAGPVAQFSNGVLC